MKAKIIITILVITIVIIGSNTITKAESINENQVQEVNKTNQIPTQTEEKVEGRIEITKISAENNEKYNIKKGQAIANVWYEIYKEETFELVDMIKTNEQGIAISRKLPCGYYIIQESQTVDEFYLDNESYSVCIEENNQMIKITSKSKVDEAYLERKEEREKQHNQNIKIEEEQEETINNKGPKLPRTGF